MLDIKYDPSTQVYRIKMDSEYKEGKYDVHQVAQMIHNYLIVKMNMEEITNDLQT